MPETLAGTGALIRLGLRRDRWLLPLWIAGFALIAYSTARAGAELYPDVASRIEASTALNATASMVALFGRIYDPGSIGALSLIKYTAFMTAILAVLMVILTIRHTRSDEETGRLELLGGGRLGRDAPLASALTISLGANVVLGLLSAAGLAAGGLPAAGVGVRTKKRSRHPSGGSANYPRNFPPIGNGSTPTRTASWACTNGARRAGTWKNSTKWI